MGKPLADMTPEEKRNRCQVALYAQVPAEVADDIVGIVAALRDADREAGVASVRAIQEDIIAAAEKAAQLADCPTCGGEGGTVFQASVPLTCADCGGTGKVPKYRRALLLAAEAMFGLTLHPGDTPLETIASIADFVRTFEPEGMDDA